MTMLWNHSKTVKLQTVVVVDMHALEMDGIQVFAFCSCWSFLVPYAVSKPRLIFPWPSSSTAPCPSNQSFSWCSAANKTVTLHFTRVVILQQICSMRNQELLKSDENGSFFFAAQVLSRQDVLAAPPEVGNGASKAFVTASVAFSCCLGFVSLYFSHL